MRAGSAAGGGDRKRKAEKYLAANKQRSSIHRFPRRMIVPRGRAGACASAEEGLNRGGDRL